MSELNLIYPKGQADQLLAVDTGLNAVDTSLNKVLTTSEKLITALNESGISFDKVAGAQKQVENNSKELDTVGKQLETSQKKLDSLEDKRTKTIVKNKLEIQKQTKSTKDLIKAQTAQKGSNEQLSAVNVILEKRLSKVNQTTDKGKRSADLLRSAIDKNNKKIDDQSSKLSKNKRNVGGYSEGIQDAAGKTGLFSRELTIITRIQATFTLLTQKKTAAQNASTAATTLGSKALNIFKIALLSTGIGAILVALGSLVAFFKASEEGAAALERTLSPFKILFGNLKDLVVAVGEGLFNAFSNPKEAVISLWEAIKTNILNRITGLIDTFKFFGKTIKAAFDLDFDEVKKNAALAGESLVQTLTGVDDAVGKATRGIKNFADETKKENDQNKQLINARLALIKREREASVDLAKLEVEIQKNRLKLKDEDNLSDAERLVFAEKAQAQIAEQGRIEEELAAKRLKFRQLENSFSISSQEDLDEEARLRVELVNVEAAATKKTLRIESERQTILKKIKKEGSDQDKELRAEREAFVEQDEALIDQEIANEQRKQDEVLALEIKGNEERQKESEKAAKENKRIDEMRAQDTVSIATAMGDALGALASGQIKSFKEFSKQILLIALDAVEKRILLTQLEILAKDIATKGFFGIATAAIKIGVIKAAFSTVKGVIAAFHGGTDSTPSEFIAGDKKGGGSARELMRLKTGQLMMVNEPTHFKGNKYQGATVYSNPETEKIISQANSQSNVYFDSEGIRDDIKALNRTIKNKPSAIIQDGRVTGEQTSNHRVTYLNRLKYG